MRMEDIIRERGGRLQEVAASRVEHHGAAGWRLAPEEIAKLDALSAGA